jgi:endonuclease/exonuclease/phosphatase family metal-dependent hydrolase
VNATPAPDGAVALMGDMNCGPETSQAIGADTAAFDRLIAAGYEAPYAEGDDAPCTFCTDNPLTGISTEETDIGAILDHVLFSGMPADLVRSARRVLDDTIEVDVEGEAVQTTHSDHYGVLVSVSGP